MTENIDHPDHYGGDTPYEVIKVLRAWDLQLAKGFCWGNLIKYTARAGQKGSAVEDRRKAVWYADELASIEEEIASQERAASINTLSVDAIRESEGLPPISLPEVKFIRIENCTNYTADHTEARFVRYDETTLVADVITGAVEGFGFPLWDYYKLIAVRDGMRNELSPASKVTGVVKDYKAQVPEYRLLEADQA
jgi:hypothetical protein